MGTGIHIPITVDTQQIDKGTKKLDILNKALRESNEMADIGLGAKAKTTSQSGIDKTSQKAAEAAKQYRLEIEGAQRATEKLARDQENIAKARKAENTQTSRINTTDGGRVSGADSARLKQEAEAHAKQFWKEIEESGKRKTIAERYEQQFGNRGRTVQEQPEGGDEKGGIMSLAQSIPGLGKFMTLAGTAAAVYTFARHSMAKHREFSNLEAQLGGRGIDAGKIDPNILGGRLQAMPVINEVSRAGGYTGDQAIYYGSKIQELSKATGTDAGFLTSMTGQLRDVSGTKLDPTKFMSLLFNISKNTGESPERTGKVVNTAISELARAKGDLTAADQAGMLGLVEKMAGMGAMGKNPATLSAMKDALKPTGSAMYDISAFKAMGLFEGPMTIEKLNKKEQWEREGLLTKNGRDIFKKMMLDHKDNPEMQTFLSGQGALRQLSPAQRATFVKDLLAGKFENASSKDMTAYLSGAGNQYEDVTNEKVAAYKKTAAASYERIDAKKENILISTGKNIYTAFHRFEESVLEAAENIANSDLLREIASIPDKIMEIQGNKPVGVFGLKTKGYDSLAEKYGAKYGVDPAVIKAFMSVESSFNPDAVSPTGQGIGLMGINPYAHKNFTREELFNPDNNVNEGARILSEYSKQSGGDFEETVARYGGYYKGKGDYKPGFAAYLNKIRKTLSWTDNLSYIPFGIGERMIDRKYNYHPVVTEADKAMIQEMPKPTTFDLTDNTIRKLADAIKTTTSRRGHVPVIATGNK